jgi:hypothetical protein
MELGGALRNKSLKIRWPDTPDFSSSEQASLDNARVTPVTGPFLGVENWIESVPTENIGSEKMSRG